PALPARGARRLRRGAAGSRGLRHQLVQAGGGHHRERGGARLPGRPRARPRRGPVPGPQLLPVGGAQSPLDLPHCRDLVDLAGDFRFFLSYPWNVHRAVEAVSTHKGGSIMAQKAIVKLCMCLVLVLLVGVATSAWSQSASGDNKGKGYSDSKKAAM